MNFPRRQKPKKTPLPPLLRVVLLVAAMRAVLKVLVAPMPLYTPHVSTESVLTSKPPAADRRLTYGPDPNQFVDVRLPAGAGPHPVVFFIHGGYWRAKYDLEHAGHLCAALARAGIATWNVEYRRVGNPGGGWPGTFEDVRGAWRLLNSAESGHEFDRRRICAAGHSAGGHLALCLAAFEESVSRVLSLAGVLDLLRAWELHLSNDAASEFLGGSPEQVPGHYREASPAAKAIPNAVQKIVHGTADESVPWEIGRNYIEAKTKAGERAEFISLPGTGHFEIIDPESEVWPRIEAEFRALLH